MITMKDRKLWLPAALAVILVAGGYYAWLKFGTSDLPDGFARGNGRIEATEVDISTKIAGRIRDVLVKEGDFVTAGQVVARMDTAQLEARLRQAEAELNRARISVGAAQSVVAQREAEKRSAAAIIEQRKAELDAAARKLARTAQLVKTKAVSEQALDNDRAATNGAKAAVAAAEAQLAASEAGIGAAKAQVVDAGATVESTKAAIDSIVVDINDSALKAPLDGRVQYRVAEPGEVLSAGGRVLSLVDLSDVYMTFFLPTAQAGRVAIGSEVRLVLDAAPQYVIPAKVSFVADSAQFTPKTVETEEERQKLMFRVKAQIAPELLRKYIRQVKTGLPGVAYIRLDPKAAWPANLQGALAR